jgi:hypothetical protein
MSNMAKAKTVGDLIEILQQFDPAMPVRAADAVKGNSDNWAWIANVAPLPPTNDMVGLFYIYPSADD